MPIGVCEFCWREIVAPRDMLVWAEEHSYHQRCYRVLLEERLAGEALV